MTSSINPNNIDGNYPVAGQPNNTQGFRDNFTNTKTNFEYAQTEINDLQGKAVLKQALTGTTLNNNMADNLIYAVKLNDISYTYLQNTASSGLITLDYAASNYQFVSTTGSVSLGFTNFPASGSHGELNFTINITNTAHTLTLPASVDTGLFGIQGISPGTVGVSNTITFGVTGEFTFRFSTDDGGTSITIFDFSRSLDRFYSTVEIQNTTQSTSPSTGALQVSGGTGITGNLSVGGNLVTFTSSGNVAFQALDTGIVEFRTPALIAANTAGALNIVGSADGSYQPVYNTGSMVHVTGNDGVSNRITLDTFGTGAAIQTSVVLRLARGTAAAPTAVQSGDILGRITGSGFGNASQYVLAAGNIGTLGVDFVALENYTTANAGSALKFYTSPVGSVTKTLSANVTANVSTFPSVSTTGNVIAGNVTTVGLISATGNITSGNLNAAGLSLTGNVVSALNVTGNITSGNISVVSNVVVNGSGGISLTDGGTVGYGAGAGGTIAQTGNKSATVILNKPSGEITMQNTLLAAASTVSFTLTNSTIASHDLLLINIVSGAATPATYNIDANCNTGSAVISVRNITAGSLSESLVLRYAVIKGSIT